MAYEFVDEPATRYEFVDVPAENPVTTSDKFARGMQDPIDGGAQLLTNMLPKGIVDGGNRLNNWLAEKTGLVAKLPEGGVNQAISDAETKYQAGRTAAGESGFDGYRTIGNVLSPANLAVAAKLPLAAAKAPLLMKTAIGAGGGAASALLNPVTEGDYWSEKGKQVAIGSAFGGAVPAVVGGVARVVSPNASLNPKLDLLKSAGVRPTIGQSLGGWANRLEEKAQSLPIVGDAITAARQRAGDDLSRASFDRALSPIGKRLPMEAKGNEAIDFTRKALGDAYDSLLPKITVQADPKFMQSINGLRSAVGSGALDPKYSKGFNKMLNDRVLNRFQGQNTMTGETFKDVQSFLTNEIKTFGRSQDPDSIRMADALKEVGRQLEDLQMRSNPKLSGELKAINTGYANFKRLQRAAGSVAAEDGVFSPAQLHSAVKALDRSKDKARFSEGNALLQDLSGAGKSMLSNKVPNSGTVDRLMVGGAGLGAGLYNPLIPAGLIGGAALYSSPIQSLLSGAVSSRHQFAKPIADALQKSSPFLIPGGAQVGLGLLK